MLKTEEKSAGYPVYLSSTYLCHRFVSFLMKVRFKVFYFTLVFAGCAAAQTFEDRNYYIEKYFSVSYPLEQLKESSPYGWRKDPFTKQRKFHYGIDYVCNNEPVLAMFDGIIKETGKDKQSGTYIVLQCGAYRISYAHLSHCTVQKGDTVFSGDTIALSGNSGRSTAPHLHLSVRYKDEYIHPQKLIDYIREVRKTCFVALDVASSNPLSPKQFISRYAPLAQKYAQLYSIPVSVILSQMAYESAWGRSQLSSKGHNYFGVKASKEWIRAGKPYTLHHDDKPDEAFCNYPSVEASMKHYAEIITGKRYSQCKKYSTTDYKSWLRILQKRGYATNPQYAEQCITIINKYRLYQYDMPSNL